MLLKGHMSPNRRCTFPRLAPPLGGIDACTMACSSCGAAKPPRNKPSLHHLVLYGCANNVDCRSWQIIACGVTTFAHGSAHTVDGDPGKQDARVRT